MVAILILSILFFQSRNQALMKQHQDLVEQVEQTHLELNTFKSLQELEGLAITKRVEVSYDLYIRFVKIINKIIGLFINCNFNIYY